MNLPLFIRERLVGSRFSKASSTQKALVLSVLVILSLLFLVNGAILLWFKLYEPDPASFVMNPAELPATSVMAMDKSCGGGKGEGVALLVVVISAVDHFEHRTMIRDTWGWEALMKGMKLYFLVGLTTPDLQMQLEEEDSKYNDILQSSTVDSYRNLTLKSLSMLHWVAQGNCSAVRFVLKIDDDILPNIAKLAHFATNASPNCGHVLMGEIAQQVGRETDKFSKNYCPEVTCFNGSTYPEFVYGSAYMFSPEVAGRLYNEAIQDFQAIYLEDVYLTGIVASRLAIARVGLYARPSDKTAQQTVDSCSFARTAIQTLHKKSPDEIRDLWLSVKMPDTVQCPNQTAMIDGMVCPGL